MTKRVMLSETRGVDLDTITSCHRLPGKPYTVEYDVNGQTLVLMGEEALVLFALWKSLSEKSYRRFQEVEPNKP